jgi:hypothetical protein
LKNDREYFKTMNYFEYRGDVIILFFLQMSGYPETVKSTLARQITKHTGAIVINHDIIKSALLESMDTFIDPKVE